MGQTASTPSPITVSNVNIKDLPTSGNATPSTKLISTMPIISTPTSNTTTTTTVLTRTPSSGSSTPAQATSATQGASIQQQLPATMIVTTHNTGTNQYQIQQAGQQFQSHQPTSINLGTTKPNTSILIRQTPSASSSTGTNTTGPSTVEALIKHQQMNKPQIHQIQVQQKTAQQQQQQQQVQTLTTSSSSSQEMNPQYQTQTSGMSAPTITKLIGGTGQPQTANPIITLTPANTAGSASSNVAASSSNTAAGSTQSAQSSTPITLSAQNPTFATLIKPINLPLSTQQKQGMWIFMIFFDFFLMYHTKPCLLVINLLPYCLENKTFPFFRS